MATKHHGKNSIIKLATAAGGSAVDISAAFDDGGEDRDADRPNAPVFGDLADRYPLLGLQDNKYNFSGFYREQSGLKVHGKAARLYANQYSMYSYLNAGKVGRKITFDNLPVFGDTAKRYPLAGLMKGSFSASGFTSYTASEIDAILRAMKVLDPSAGDTIPCWSVFQNGTAVGNYVDMFAALPMKFGTKTGEEKPVTVDLDFAVDDQLDLGVSLHAETAETNTMSGSSVDESAATSRGAVAHLHVTAFSGTSAVIKVQHSTDNSSWTDLITFTTVSAATSQRSTIATGTSISRYVRVIISAFTDPGSITFVCAFARRGFTYVTTNGNHRHFCGLISGYINGTLTSSTPLSPTSFEFHPMGTASSTPKHSSTVVIDSYEVDFGEEKPTRISVSMPVDGLITDGTN